MSLALSLKSTFINTLLRTDFAIRMYPGVASLTLIHHFGIFANKDRNAPLEIPVLAGFISYTYCFSNTQTVLESVDPVFHFASFNVVAYKYSLPATLFLTRKL